MSLLWRTLLLFLMFTCFTLPNFAQSVDSVRRIEQVEIEASVEATGFSTILNPSNRYISTTSNSIESLLKVLPGVQSANELSSQYSVRGGSFDENLVYINGIELYRPLLIRNAQQEGLSIINPYLTERIEFSTGGFGAEFGDKISSVLNIHYKKPKKNGGMVEVSFLGGQIGADLCSADGKYSSSTGIRYRNNKYLLNTLQERGTYNPNFIDLQNNVNLQISPHLQLNLVTMVSSNNYYFEPQTRQTSFGTLNRPIEFLVYFEGAERDNYAQWLQGAGLLWKTDQKWDIKFTAVAQGIYEIEKYDILSQYFISEFNDLDSKRDETKNNFAVGSNYDYARNRLTTHVYSFDISAVWQHHKQGSLKIGAKTQLHTVRDNNQSYRYLDSAGYFIPAPSSSLALEYHSQGSHNLLSQSYSLFVEERYLHRFTAVSVRLNAGIRLTHTVNNGEWLLSPRVSLLFYPKNTPALQYYISGGLYQQPPFYKELRYANGDINPRLKSQKSTHSIFGISYSLPSATIPLRISAEGYYKYLWDMVPYTQENVKLNYAAENLTKGHLYGIDLKFNAALAKNSGDSWLGISLMQGRQKMMNNEPSVYFPMATDQLFSVSAYIADEISYFPRFQFHTLLSYGTGLPSFPPHRQQYTNHFRAKAYKRVDVGLSYVFFDHRHHSPRIKYFKSLKLSLDILNLFDFNNIASYSWVRALAQVPGQSVEFVAVPNYLTGRRFNINLICTF